MFPLAYLRGHPLCLLSRVYQRLQEPFAPRQPGSDDTTGGLVEPVAPTEGVKQTQSTSCHDIFEDPFSR